MSIVVTPKQADVILLMAAGNKVPEISKKLGVRYSGVTSLIKRLRRAANAKTNDQMMWQLAKKGYTVRASSHWTNAEKQRIKTVLTTPQMEALELYAAGCSCEKIAEQLDISIGAVNQRLARARSTAGVKSTAQLAQLLGLKYKVRLMP